MRSIDQHPETGPIRRTVGIHDDENIGRIGTQVVGGKGKREALSSPLQIVTLDHFGTGRARSRRGRIGAIVRNDENPHVGAERFGERLKSLTDNSCLVVGRHDDHRGRGRRLGPGANFSSQTRRDLDEEKCREHCERGKQDCYDRGHFTVPISFPATIP